MQYLCISWARLVSFNFLMYLRQLALSLKGICWAACHLFRISSLSRHSRLQSKEIFRSPMYACSAKCRTSVVNAGTLTAMHRSCKLFFVMPIFASQVVSYTAQHGSVPHQNSYCTTRNAAAIRALGFSHRYEQYACKQIGAVPSYQAR